jgi:hypothetical protein
VFVGSMTSFLIPLTWGEFYESRMFHLHSRLLEVKMPELMLLNGFEQRKS